MVLSTALAMYIAAIILLIITQINEVSSIIDAYQRSQAEDKTKDNAMWFGTIAQV